MAYEMRISDWSADVCSADLDIDFPARGCGAQKHGARAGPKFTVLSEAVSDRARTAGYVDVVARIGIGRVVCAMPASDELPVREIGTAPCRERVWPSV